MMVMQRLIAHSAGRTLLLVQAVFRLRMVVMMACCGNPAAIMRKDRFVHASQQDRQHNHEPDKGTLHGPPDSRPIASGQLHPHDSTLSRMACSSLEIGMALKALTLARPVLP